MLLTSIVTVVLLLVLLTVVPLIPGMIVSRFLVNAMTPGAVDRRSVQRRSSPAPPARLR